MSATIVEFRADRVNWTRRGRAGAALRRQRQLLLGRIEIAQFFGITAIVPMSTPLVPAKMPRHGPQAPQDGDRPSPGGPPPPPHPPPPGPPPPRPNRRRAPAP